MKRSVRILFCLVLIFLTAASAGAQTPPVDGAPVTLSTQRRYDLALRAQSLWLMIQMTFDAKNRWVYEKELSDCYAQLGEMDKAQEELKASIADNPNGVPAPEPTMRKIRRHRKKVGLAVTPEPTVETPVSTKTMATSTPRGKVTLTPTHIPTDTPADEVATAPATESDTTSSNAAVTPTEQPTAAPVTIGTLTLGSYFGLWSVNYADPTNGAEILFPVSASVNLASDIALTASTNYLVGYYQYQAGDTLDLNSFSDTTVAVQYGFKTLDLDTVLSETVNIPTGEPSWTSQSSGSDLPIFLVDPRYSAAALSFNTLYAISIPVDSSKWGLGMGYVLNTDYNSNGGWAVDAVDVRPGDSLYFSMNRVTPTGSNQSDVFQASVYFSFVTTESGIPFTCPGPNINFSYAWNNPTAFSFELGSQFYLPGQTAVNGVLAPDPTYSSGPRLYLKPSYVIDNLTLAGQVKYVLPNGYDASDLNYVEGGLLLSVGPNYNLKLDGQAFLTLTASYNFVDSLGGGFDANGNRVDLLYNWFNCSASYSFTF